MTNAARLEVRGLVVRRVAIQVVNLEAGGGAADTAAPAVSGDDLGAELAPRSRRATPKAESLASCVGLPVSHAAAPTLFVETPAATALQNHGRERAAGTKGEGPTARSG